MGYSGRRCWLEREAASQADEEDAPIDPEIGITFADFRSTLLYVRVTSIEFREGLYLRSRLGQLEQRGLND